MATTKALITPLFQTALKDFKIFAACLKILLDIVFYKIIFM